MKRLLPFQPYEPVANVLGTSAVVPMKPGSVDASVTVPSSASTGGVCVMLTWMGSARALNALAAMFACPTTRQFSLVCSVRLPPHTRRACSGRRRHRADRTYLGTLLAAATAAAALRRGVCLVGLWRLRAPGGGARALVFGGAFPGRCGAVRCVSHLLEWRGSARVSRNSRIVMS